MNIDVTIGTITSSTIEVKWKPVAVKRITGYIVSYKDSRKTNFIDSAAIDNSKTTFVLSRLEPQTEYTIKMVALGFGSRQSKESVHQRATTLQSKSLFQFNLYY